MRQSMIEELKRDCEDHLRRAAQGDRRSAYAAKETFERLIELGADAAWLDRTASSPALSEPIHLVFQGE